MAAKEKLQYIYDSTISAIRTHGEEELAEIKARLDESLEKYRKDAQAESEMQERIHRDNIKREVQKQLASQKIALRRERAEREGQITEKLFEEVTEILNEYRHTPEYKQLLVDLVDKTKEFADDDEVIVYICRDDEDIKDELEEKCGISLVVSDVPFRGGIQAEIPSRNIFINNSFSSRVAEAERSYIVKA